MSYLMYEESITTRKKLNYKGDRKGLGIAISKFANRLIDLNDFEGGIRRFKESLEYFKKDGKDDKQLAGVYNNIAVAYKNAGKDEKIYKNLGQKSIYLWKKTLGENHEQVKKAIKLWGEPSVIIIKENENFKYVDEL